MGIPAPFIISAYHFRLFYKDHTLTGQVSCIRTGTGSISHLNYALRINIVVITLLSTAISTIIFPRLSKDYSLNNLDNFKDTISTGLRGMYFIIAPVIGLGFVLTLPFVQVFLERGAFFIHDSIEVASLLKIYLFSIIPASLGAITGKALYSLKVTKIISILGTLESVLYILYTYLLVKHLGVAGVPIGYGLYFSGSLIWALWLIRHKVKRRGGEIHLIRIFQDHCSSHDYICADFLVAYYIKVAILQLLIGGIGGIILYFSLAILFRSGEARKILLILFPNVKKQD